ncbi:MAG: pentapeptide repeat-containing protein, partial [Actinobacteria bacterium]|nr:pentapeptide repeat-containing protein [Actinomycetota bacterium]
MVSQRPIFRYGANLSGANLSGLDLTNEENLYHVNLSNSNLSHANLSGLSFLKTNLAGADLSNSNLSRANLSRANLYEANLTGADLSNSNLSKAIMQDGAVHVKIIDEVNKDLEEKFYHVSDLLLESEWVVLKENEDAYRRTGALPTGYVKVSNNRLNLTFHLSRKHSSGPSTSHLISRIFYFAKENGNAIN